MVKNKSDNPSKIFLFIATKGVINTCLITNSDESKTINNKKSFLIHICYQSNNYICKDQ